MTKPCEKICKNCESWEVLAGHVYLGDCTISGDTRLLSHSCREFEVDKTSFCGVCLCPAVEEPHSSLVCTGNGDHVASQWDLEWRDFGGETHEK